MLYLLYGPQGIMLEKQCQKILKENLPLIDDFHCVKQDATEISIQDIIEEANLPSLTGDRKAIVIEKCYFLKQDKGKEKIENDQDYETLLQYLRVPNPDVDVLFVCETDKLQERSEIVKILKEKARIIEAKEITKEEWPRYIRQYLQKAQVSIDDDAVEEFVIRVEGDALRFTNEAKKMMLYTNHITLADVEKMIARPLEENVYAICDYLLKGKKEKAIAIYRDLLVENEEPVRLISTLANQIRLLTEVGYLQNIYPTRAMIASKLGVHEFRVKLALDHLKRISLTSLYAALDQLYQLDEDIKSGKIERFYGFELFLLRFQA